MENESSIAVQELIRKRFLYADTQEALGWGFPRLALGFRQFKIQNIAQATLPVSTQYSDIPDLC